MMHSPPMRGSRVSRIQFDLHPTALGAPTGRAPVARVHAHLPDAEVEWSTGEEDRFRARPTVIIDLDPDLTALATAALHGLPRPPRVGQVSSVDALVDDTTVPDDGVCILCISAQDPAVTNHAARLREALPTWSVVVVLGGDVPFSTGLLPLRAGADEVLTADELGPGRLSRSLHGIRSRRRREMDLRVDAKRMRAVIDALAHDIRAPLATCDWLLEELLGRLPEEGAGEAGVTAQRIRGAFTGVEELVEDVLVLARVDGRRRRRERVDVTEVVREVCQELEADVQRRDAEMTFDLPPDGVAVLRGANSEVRLLFRNLLANAVKYGDTDGCKVHVRGFPIKKGRADGWRFEVSDNGPGVAPNLVTQIFEPFFRAPDAAAQREQGTGLGLAIAAGVAKAHDFDLDVVRGPMGGAMFVVEVPAHRVEGAGLLGRPSTRAPQETPSMTEAQLRQNPAEARPRTLF